MISTEDEAYKRAKSQRDPSKRLMIILGKCQSKKKCIGGAKLDETEDPDMMDGAAAGGCGGIQPKITREGIFINREFSESEEQRASGTDRKEKLQAEHILRIFKGISDEDIRILGLDPVYSRPEWLIIKNFPVGPPAVRPTVIMSSSSVSSDDLTHAYIDIVKMNKKIQEAMESNALRSRIDTLTEALQVKVTNIMDNTRSDCENATRKSGKPIKSIRERLVGKAGRVRGNLMGKRCDFTARTVITGDPNLGIDQVGVPRSIAKNLTFPERVTKFNIEILRAAVCNGADNYPGAKKIHTNDGRTISLLTRQDSNDLHIEIGYIVERHIKDGDYVLFNRQPSLHKMSIMSHKVKVMPFSSFRLNLSCTTPYNADFDGDEMNLHVPQSQVARAEASEIMLVPRQIVSPQSNRPVIGIVQDALLGCREFTKRDVFVGKSFLFDVLMHLDDWSSDIPIPAILKPEPLWTGKQIFSLLLPVKINMGYKQANGHNKKFDKNENFSWGDTIVNVVAGQLLSGMVDKESVGNKYGSLIHLIWMECGWDETRKFITQCQKVINRYLIVRSLTIGIADTIADERALREVQGIVLQAKEKASELILKAQRGDIKQLPGQTIINSFENAIQTVLGDTTKATGEGLQSWHKY